jgi:hypothetical protein
MITLAGHGIPALPTYGPGQGGDCLVPPYREWGRLIDDGTMLRLFFIPLDHGVPVQSTLLEDPTLRRGCLRG